MLWLALHFPTLPLDLWSRGQAEPEPLAVTEGAGRPRVMACNLAATLAGVKSGMALAAALAVEPRLKAKARDLRAEEAALERLAAWAGRYTPEASLQMPSGLLLQIAQSLNLFGGLEALLRQIRHDLDALGYLTLYAVAPTPHGAWLLARAGLEIQATTLEDMTKHLAALPIKLMEQPAAVLELLQQIGVTKLGECLSLPRNGLARRAGPGLLDELDRAFGHRPEPRRFYTPPPRYGAELELPYAVENAEALLFAARRLLAELVGFLAARSAGVQRLALDLRHENKTATRLIWGLIAPSRDLDHLTGLLKERLDRLELAAPVLAIALETLELRDLKAAGTGLFDDAASTHWNASKAEDRWRLLERLAERLGSEAVTGLTLNPDHRPERAWRTRNPSDLKPARTTPLHSNSATTTRPTWLLPDPQPLVHQGNILHWQGPLALLAGPERIESGWWDAAPASRDYYLAETADGARLWVYREKEQWFLEGIFG